MFRKILNLVKWHGMEVTTKSFLEGQVHGVGILDSLRIGVMGWEFWIAKGLVWLVQAVVRFTMVSQ